MTFQDWFDERLVQYMEANDGPGMAYHQLHRKRMEEAWDAALAQAAEAKGSQQR